MTDIVDRETRSRMMAGIRGTNTKPELALRRALHARGFRFRLHAKGLAGRPDLLLPKYRAAVFAHGCFWHRHDGCRHTTTPLTRSEFWQAKFDANVLRDAGVRKSLLEQGWRVAILWECALRKPSHLEIAVSLLAEWLGGTSSEIEIGNPFGGTVEQRVAGD